MKLPRWLPGLTVPRPSARIVATALVALGVLTCCVGIGLVYLPAAPIVGGLAAVAYGLLAIEVDRR